LVEPELRRGRQRAASRKARKEQPAPNTQAQAIARAKAQTVSSELKLIAQRVEQALENLDKYIDEAFAAGLPQVRVIHGHGTGALRTAVWQYLKGHPAVESYRLGEQSEGGAGATIVKLKQ
jgi:DNA mismatch repair protein MutS2